MSKQVITICSKQWRDLININIAQEQCNMASRLGKNFTRLQIFSLEIFLHQALRAPIRPPGPWGFSLTSLMDDPAMSLCHSVVPAWCLQSGTLSSFNALKLLTESREGHLTGKTLFQNPLVSLKIKVKIGYVW